MKTRTKYWLCIFFSFAFSAGVPIVAIVKKFPLWKQAASPALTVGAGGILAIIVLAICFRKTLLPTIKKKLGITSTPSVFLWLFGLMAVEFLSRINTFMVDIKGVIIAGIFGSAVGWAFSLMSVRYDNKLQAEKIESNKKE